MPNLNLTILSHILSAFLLELKHAKFQRPCNLGFVRIRTWWPEGMSYSQKEKLKAQALWFLGKKRRGGGKKKGSRKRRKGQRIRQALKASSSQSAVGIRQKSEEKTSLKQPEKLISGTGNTATDTNGIEKIINFRKKLFELFTYRSDATLDLVDAIAGQTSKESIVKLSLNSLFRRGYSSITDVLDNLFRTKANKNPQPEELTQEQLKVTQLLVSQCPKPEKRRFVVLSLDCTSVPRIYAAKLQDRGFVHAPTKVPGQKPITVGHQYSVVTYSPERSHFSEPHWVVPLSVLRVKTEETGTAVGLAQIEQIASETDFKNHLCVVAEDSAYSVAPCMQRLNHLKNVIEIVRMRNNRSFNIVPGKVGELSSGRPRIYGDQWVLSNPGESDESTTIEHYTAKGKLIYLKINRWYDRQAKGETIQSQEHKAVNNTSTSIPVEEPLKDQKKTKKNSTKNSANPVLFDAVRVRALSEDGQPLFQKPLWLMLRGLRRKELSLQDIAQSYLQRYDIEHFFRFSKQRLLLTSFQTPDVRHEENWCWLCIMGYTMLYGARYLANHIRYPWEQKRRREDVGKAQTPSQVQRDYERITNKIGTPACEPKLRGKSPGRSKGTEVPKRKDWPIIKKSELPPKVAAA